MAKTFRHQRSEEKPKGKYKRSSNHNKDIIDTDSVETEDGQDYGFHETEEYQEG